LNIGIDSDVVVGTLPMLNDSFQSDIFFSDIGIIDVDVGSDVADIKIDVDAHL
jgi:hypothetical protein